MCYVLKKPYAFILAIIIWISNCTLRSLAVNASSEHYFLCSDDQHRVVLHTYQTAALNASDRVRVQAKTVLNLQNKAFLMSWSTWIAREHPFTYLVITHLPNQLNNDL